MNFLHGSGVTEFSVTNGDTVQWVFADGSMSNEATVSKNLSAGTSYVFISNWTDSDIVVNGERVFGTDRTWESLPLTQTSAVFSVGTGTNDSTDISIYGVLNGSVTPTTESINITPLEIYENGTIYVDTDGTLPELEIVYSITD